MSDGPSGRDPIIFDTRHRVRFREIDVYGHMNMAHYLAYYMDHRFEGMRRFIGLDFREIAELSVAFHTRNVEIEYLRPLVADQEFTIRSHVSELKKSQCVVDFTMVDADEKVVSTAKMRVGCIDKAKTKPCGWPNGLMERFFK